MNSKINRIRMIAVAVFFVVAAVAGYELFFSQLRSKSKAASAPAGTAIMSIVAVNNPPMDGNNILRMGVDINPNGSKTDLYAFDIQLTYDSSKLGFANDGGVANNIDLMGGALKQQITQVDANTIRIVGTRKGTPFPSGGGRVVEIAFKMKESQTFPVSFNWGSTLLQSNDFIKIPLTLSSNSTGTSSTGTTAVAPVALSFSPGASSFEVGTLASVDVMLNTAGKQIGSTTVTFAYDQTKLSHAATVINTAIFNGPSSSPIPSGGVVTITAKRNSGISGMVKVATVRFTTKAVGGAPLSFNKAASSAVVYGSTANLLTKADSVMLTIVPVGTGVNSVGASYTSATGAKSSAAAGEHVESNGDVLHINGIVYTQAPFRYEQIVKLDAGDYTLAGAARVYTARGRGVVVTLACGEMDCGDGKRLNDFLGKTPQFVESTDFQEQKTAVHISGNQKDKKLVVRIFVEDGSEADFDYVSLTDPWGGQHLTNYHFGQTEKVTSPRKLPQYWDADSTGQVFGTIDSQRVADGASLFINSSSRK